jgi:hypothetical protein
MIEIRNYIIGIVIFTFFIVGGVTMMGILYADKPSVTNDTQYVAFNQTFNKITDVTTQVEGIESGIKDAQPEQGLFGVLSSLVSTAWNSLKLIFTSFNFMDDVIGGLSTVFGVPAFIPSLILLMISLILVFGIWKAVFQTR